MHLLRNIQAIFFDMDGTLVDSIPFHQRAWLRFLDIYGIPLKPEEFNTQNHGTIHEMVRRFFPYVDSKERQLELGEEKEVLFRTIYQPHLEEIVGLTHFLEHLQSLGISRHLSTMGDQNNIDFTLDGLGIRHFFDTITGGHEVLKGKPDPEIFLRSLEKAGVEPKQALAFEDSGGGIRAARAAGLRVIGIASTHSKKELVEMACEAAYTNFLEILQEIKKP